MKTVRAVVHRFYYLNWGGWVRTRSMRKKRLWKKPESWKAKLRWHVLCNSQQTRMLKHMTSKYWKLRRYYPEDPYEPYHTRNWFKSTGPASRV
jgi:large subunit ribosomal protein L35